MKVLRIIIGVLATLYILLHLVEIPSFLSQMESMAPELRFSAGAGKLTAMIIGILAAIWGFRKKQPSPGQQSEPPPLPHSRSSQ